MSWASTNYEKVVLGGATTLALGLSYLGWSTYAGVLKDFDIHLNGSGHATTAVKNADAIAQTMASLKLDRSWVQALDGTRKVDLFTGLTLFVSRDAPDKPLDLGSENSAPVHPPIPNSWWLQNHIDPGFADAAHSDPDQDGFSNIEEFIAHTDPNDPKVYPPLIAKLMYVKDESLTWVLRPTGQNGSFSFTYLDSKKAVNKTNIVEPVAPNGFFFTSGPMIHRFKLLGSEVKKELNKHTGEENEVTFVRIEDQQPNKMGTVYEYPASYPPANANQFQKYDRSALISLEALGLNGKEFKVEENTTFALPFDNPKKDFLAKVVTPASITVEYTDKDGQKKTVDIKRGSIAQPVD